VDGVINKMRFLVCDQCERAFELGQNAIVQKLDDNYCHFCSQNLSLHPFGNVIHWSTNIYLSLIYCPMALMGPTKSSPHLVNNMVINLAMLVLVTFHVFDTKIWKNAWYLCE